MIIIIITIIRVIELAIIQGGQLMRLFVFPFHGSAITQCNRPIEIILSGAIPSLYHSVALCITTYTASDTFFVPPCGTLYQYL